MVYSMKLPPSPKLRGYPCDREIQEIDGYFVGTRRFVSTNSSFWQYKVSARKADFDDFVASVSDWIGEAKMVAIDDENVAIPEFADRQSARASAIVKIRKVQNESLDAV